MADASRPALPGSLAKTPRLSAWLRIEADGAVIATPGKVELGQGVLTALTTIVAEELDVSPAAVRLRPAATDRSPDEGVTSGSLSVQDSGMALAQAAAEVRALFRAEAARRLGVAEADLSVEGGVFTGPGNARIGYAEMAGAVDLDRDARGLAAPRPAAARRLRGRAAPRVDIPGRVFGARPYVHDLSPERALHGRVVRSDAAHARLTALDDGPARAVAGVVAIHRDGNFLGVLAETEAAAERAAAKLAQGAQWDVEDALPDQHALADWLRAQPVDPRVVERRGARPENPARTLERDYMRQPIAHASIAPSAAVAQWTGERLRVWTHSQGVFNLRADLALVFRMDPAAIVVEHAEGAGCYGHNGADDAALDAALLARAAEDRPVRLRWSRRDEMIHAPMGAAQLVRIGADLDADGRIAAWRHTVWSNGHTARPGRAAAPVLRAATEIEGGWPPFVSVDPPQAGGGGSDRNSLPLYDVPASEVIANRLTVMPLRTSSLRSLGAFANVFAIESFMDELAEQAGADALDFRLKHLSDPRARAVLETVAQRGGWGAAPAEGRGRGLGVARYKSKGAWCAALAEVSVAEDVRVERLTLAVDVGDVVDPDGVANQIEGGAVQAASWLLKEAVRFDHARILTTDWDSYPILRFSEVPAVDVHILNRPDEPSLGAGECAHGPVAGAVANAVARALGVRVRSLPIDRDALIAAMELS